MTIFYAETAPGFALRLHDVMPEFRQDVESSTLSMLRGMPSKTIERNRINGLSDWQIKKITRHIDRNLATSLKISALADLVQLSASHFSRNFKVSFGESPYAYVLSRRIELAKHLIRDTEEPLSQIAQACGMSDQAHLCKVFKRLAGTTPQGWRQRGSVQGIRTVHAQTRSNTRLHAGGAVTLSDVI